MTLAKVRNLRKGGETESPRPTLLQANKKGRPHKGRPSVQLALGNGTTVSSSPPGPALSEAEGPALSEVEGSRIHPGQLAPCPVHAEREVVAVLAPDGQVIYRKIAILPGATPRQPEVNALYQLGRGHAEEASSRW